MFTGIPEMTNSTVKMAFDNIYILLWNNVLTLEELQNFYKIS